MTAAEIRRALATAKVRHVQVVRRGIGGSAPLVLVGEVAEQQAKIEAALEAIGLRLGRKARGYDKQLLAEFDVNRDIDEEVRVLRESRNGSRRKAAWTEISVGAGLSLMVAVAGAVAGMVVTPSLLFGIAIGLPVGGALFSTADRW